MKVQRLRACVGFFAIVLAACGGGGGGGGGGQPNPPQTPQSQTIAFAQASPLNLALGSTTSNAASGGAGTGAITYQSSDPLVASVDANGGVIGVGIGATTITATKAASSAHLQAQATYTLNVQTADTVSAWIGVSSTAIHAPLSANGKQLGRARVTDCDVTDTVATCDLAELAAVNGPAAIADTRTTLTTPAYLAIVNGASIGTPVLANAQHFSGRLGHGAVYFKNRYWVIGGSEVAAPGLPLQGRQLADVWSSADGRSWKLETANGGFGARWFHQTVVYNNEIWVISGSLGSTVRNDAWSSSDGITWTQRSINVGVPAPSIALNAVAFKGALWIVSGGQTYTWNGTAFVLASQPGVLGAPRSYASLTSFNGKLWYVAGAPALIGQSGNGSNDVWSSTDGVNWTLSTGQFAPRVQHTAFVRNQRLWVMGGRSMANGVVSGQSGDAWSTSDGVTWAQENTGYLARGYFMKSFDDAPGAATLTGGIVRGYSHHVWQASNSAEWTALSAAAQFSPRFADAIAFNNYLWVIGGGAMEVRDSAGGTTNEIWRSADGLNWSKVTPSGTIFSPRAGHRLAVFNNRLWLIGGWDDLISLGGSETRFNDVWSTSDGVTWTRHADGGFTPRVAHDVAVFNGKLWVVGGSAANSAGSNDVWSTTNGDNWTREAASAAFPPRYSHRVLAANNALWVIAGSDGTVGLTDVWRSADGVNWTSAQPNAFPAGRSRHAAAVLNNRLYVIGGASDETFEAVRYNDVWSSSDGITWRQDVASAPFEGRQLHGLAVRNNELFLIGGLGWSFLNDVWRSSDGVNWRLGFSHPITAP